MRVRVRFFAGTREAAGSASLEVDVPPSATVAVLLDALEAQRPRLAPYRAHALVAQNGAFTTESARLSEGDELALMPPVSGGSGEARIDDAAFSLDELVASLASKGAGAVVTFTGLVRPTSGERPEADVASLTFEAYAELAERTLSEVREEACAKFGLLDLAVRHRLGTLPVGEPIVAVVAAARHRREAFEATQWVMDELKTRVPIWKQEVDADGARRWVNDPTGGT